MEWGYDSPRGRSALRRMNQLHGRFQIANLDFLYVLSTFVFEPIRWNARFGWRAMCGQERLAMFYFWREVGGRMNIKDIPAVSAFLGPRGPCAGWSEDAYRCVPLSCAGCRRGNGPACVRKCGTELIPKVTASKNWGLRARQALNQIQRVDLRGAKRRVVENAPHGGRRGSAR